MSAEYYLSKGYTPSTKTIVISGPNTITVWAPVSGKRVVMTGVSFSNINAGTIAFYFDHPSEIKIAEYLLAASSTIEPMIGAWESTVVGGRIFARVGASGTDGWRVNATGFELG